MANWSSPARRAVWDRKRKDRRCSLEGCALRHYARGLCEPHWKQAQKYGLTASQMAALSPVCEICGSDGPLNIDHDHRTGAVRGSLCTSCNVALGFLRDDPERLVNALAYLTRAAA